MAKTSKRAAGAARVGGKDSVLAAIADLPAARGNRARDSIAVGTNYRPGGMSVIIEAAKLRKLSVAAFLRRASYAMAAHDLGIPLSEVLQRDPRVTRDTGYALDDPEGTMFGPWEIERLVGEETP